MTDRNEGSPPGRGFNNNVDRSKQRDIASKGGESVAPEKRSFSQDSKLASEAGREGGEATAAKSKSSDGENQD